MRVGQMIIIDNNVASVPHHSFHDLRFGCRVSLYRDYPCEYVGCKLEDGGKLVLNSTLSEELKVIHHDAPLSQLWESQKVSCNIEKENYY